MKKTAIVLASSAVVVAGLLVGTTSASAEDVPTCQGKPATIVAGPGEAVVGTPGDDVVVATDSTSIEAQEVSDIICVTSGPGATTTISAGEGDDVVEATVEGADVIRLEGGDDLVAYWGSPDQAQVLEGGSGRNTLMVMGDSQLVAHNRAQTLGIAEGSKTRMVGFLDFVAGPQATLRLMGGEAAERVTTQGGTVSGQLGGGDDVMEAGLGEIGSLKGQKGHDRLVLGPGDPLGEPLRVRVRVELPAERLLIRGEVEGGAEVDVEDITVMGARKVRIIGDEVANHLLVVGACNARLGGGAGRDVLKVRDAACSMRGARIFGGKGSDRMFGGDFADLLDGGAGGDVADGGPNTDLCRAEVRHKCELR